MSGQPHSVRRKPEWLRRKMPPRGRSASITQIIDRNRVQTVCTEAMCPNRGECFARGTATFLLLGPYCTRHCTFCNVGKGKPFVPDPTEPSRVARAVVEMGLQYAVITMVTRDDLPDGGCHHVIETLHTVNSLAPEILIELLVSDMSGNWDSLARLLEASPCVFAHNIETCEKLYPHVRPEGAYSRSLEMISRASQLARDVITKSGFMVGLGETRSEISELLVDLREAGTRILAVGQYLAPTQMHHPVFKYYSPDEFLDIEAEALSLGFSGVAAGPWVRSSFQAKTLYESVHRHFMKIRNESQPLS